MSFQLASSDAKSGLPRVQQAKDFYTVETVAPYTYEPASCLFCANSRVTHFDWSLPKFECQARVMQRHVHSVRCPSTFMTVIYTYIHGGHWDLPYTLHEFGAGNDYGSP